MIPFPLEWNYFPKLNFPSNFTSIYPFAFWFSNLTSVMISMTGIRLIFTKKHGSYIGVGKKPRTNSFNYGAPGGTCVKKMVCMRKNLLHMSPVSWFMISCGIFRILKIYIVDLRSWLYPSVWPFPCQKCFIIFMESRLLSGSFLCSPETLVCIGYFLMHNKNFLFLLLHISFRDFMFYTENGKEYKTTVF